MINHGLSTGALFLLVGFIYERYHTRDIHEIGGLGRRMPWFAFFLIFFTLSSIALPGLNGFVGEFLTLAGTAISGTRMDGLPSGPLGYGYVIPAALGIILGAVYMLWMCQRILFGPLTEPPDTPDASHGLTTDLTRREIGILAPIALCCVILGVYPKPILDTFEVATRHHIVPAGGIDAAFGGSASDVHSSLIAGANLSGSFPFGGHSERSEESLARPYPEALEMLRCAQHDKMASDSIPSFEGDARQRGHDHCAQPDRAQPGDRAEFGDRAPPDEGLAAELRIKEAGL
jgi:NADH:ubiquinone oxidoreductase subunit 5 (subunit L)/multisubunit Na+/H+ antiporter MnhA subunit